MSPLILPAQPDVAVGLFAFERPAAIVVRAVGGWTLRGSDGPRPIAPGTAVSFTAVGAAIEARWPGGHGRAGRWRLSGPAPFALATGPGQAPARRVTGALTIHAEGGRLAPVVHVPLEAYVAGVMAHEVPADWPRAALEAQAIAARTYSVARRGATGHPGRDFCDATHCQRFRGTLGGDRRLTAAARDTRGQVLAWRGEAAETTWHAACGGMRASSADLFGAAAPAYLAGGPDRRPDGTAWCAASPYAAAWSVLAPAEVARAALRDAGRLGPLEPLLGLSVAAAGPGGHVRAVRVAASRARLVSGMDLWEALGPRLGWVGLRSPAFTIAREPAGWRFSGRGLGHGVGLCQAGARGRALGGQDATRILAAYFPGTTPARLRLVW